MRRQQYSTGDGRAASTNRRDLLRMGACGVAALAAGATGLSCCPCCSQKDGAGARVEAESLPTDWTMIAYCCLECDKCDAYLATKNDDDQLRAKVAEMWHMAAEKIQCRGCKSDQAMFDCDAKKCAAAKGLPTCAHCDDFPTCDKEVWRKFPPLKEKVEAMRTRLRLS